MAGHMMDEGGRGLSPRQLFLAGLGVILASALVTGLLIAKSTGRLESYTRIIADLTNVGDGLPSRSDVRYHGLLVGTVSDVVPATYGKPNYVHIDVDSEYAGSIPRTVTARVVPSNVFAVSGVELVDRGQAQPIRSGDHIAEDTQLPTVLFQTTISKLRDILYATGRGRDDSSLGILAAVNAATQNRRVELLAAGAQLDRMVNQLNEVVATDSTSPSMLKALIEATQGLQQTAPDLVDALHRAVGPMQALVQQRTQLDSLISGGANTLGTTNAALTNQTDRLITISSKLTPVFGVLAQTSHNWLPGFQKLGDLSDKFMNEVWIPEVDTPNMRINLSLTPSYSYTRADCPQYGALKGPSCYTAPLVAVRPDLPEVLMPQNFQPPADLMPPPGTVVGPNGNLVAVGPPLINPNPNLVDPNPPLPAGMAPAPPVPGSANPAFAPPPPPPPAPAPGPTPDLPPGPPLPAEAAPASYSGNVGPVGSEQERKQLSLITGTPATTATQLLLGPLVRGMTVSTTDGTPS
jgi:ABC-type transporter Mla subunit MlaD